MGRDAAQYFDQLDDAGDVESTDLVIVERNRRKMKAAGSAVGGGGIPWESIYNADKTAVYGGAYAMRAGDDHHTVTLPSAATDPGASAEIYVSNIADAGYFVIIDATASANLYYDNSNIGRYFRLMPQETVCIKWRFNSPNSFYLMHLGRVGGMIADRGGTWKQSASARAIMTAGATLAQGNVCYVNSSNKLDKADASSTSTMPGLCMVRRAAVLDDLVEAMFQGFVTNTGWSWSPGARLYLSNTSGLVSSTAGTNTQILGVATHADRMFFNPTYNYGS